ncbi:pilus assembly protein TadG-related protein [Burkholderia sp. FERM BP-3421]|uniref:TadG family pilus assembly protein n=1 Tax=Burkholderia sp. FERM BP-3421 TaxID=1494466 RepID=UPI00235E50BB|nr:TadG family pilus assembly protein [Burkholderia sp. FERM BP-3421]WDD92841.1 pilus assembly protein TadG-related protein [Burkholderia sp. FERM BP-3421]
MEQSPRHTPVGPIPVSRTGRRAPPRRQRGSLATLAVLALAVAMVALGAIDIGNLFYQRRQLQSIADMTALAAAERMDDGCVQPPVTAQSVALANGFDSTVAGQTLSTACGRWDLKDNSGPSFYTAAASPAAGSDAQLNAVQVTVTRSVPYYFLGPARTVSAVSVAQATDIGTYSIGTTLAQLQGGAVNTLLNTMLGTNLNLSLVSYEGLASAHIKVSDLMNVAGASTVNQLLAMQVSVPTLASWLSSALAATTVVNTNLQTDLSTMSSIASATYTNSQNIALGNSTSTPGLLAVNLSDPQTALNAMISPFDILMTAAEIAAGQSALTLTGGLSIGGQGATVQMQIIQPPVIAIGEGGIDPVSHTWRTVARTAQVRLYLNVSLGTTNLPLGLLGALVPVQVSLPLSLQVASGTGWLQSAACTASTATCASVIGVQTGIANLCVGNAPTNMSASQPFSCSTPATLVNVLNLVKITALAALPASVPAATAPTLTFYGTTGGYQSTNANGVGSVLGNALSGLGASLQQTQVTLLGGLSLPLTPVESALGSFLNTALTPVLGGLDAAVVPLLQTLGVQVGESTIHDIALSCGVSTLVYQ